MKNNQGKWIKFNDSEDEWNNFILSSNGQFRQLYEWGDYKKALGWRVLRLVFKDNGVIVSSVQILGRKKYFTFNAYIPGGINGDLKHLNEDFIEVVKSNFKAMFFYIRSDFVKEETLADIGRLQKHGWTKPSYPMSSGEYFELDISLSNEELLKNAKQKWRYHHKKSLNHESLLKEEKKVEHFTKMEKELSKGRNHRNSFTEREVKPLIQKLGDKLIVCIATDKGNNLAAIRSVVIVGDTAWHHYSAVNNKGRGLLSGYRLFMYILSICRERGLKYYNLGGVNVTRYPGPYRFKRGIGYKSNHYESLGEWELSEPSYMKNILNLFIRVYLHSSSLLSKFIKNL